ncbi:unnamed protein product [Heligmosomoides polygyrus]|uniref:Uncharacterized protein n=1 Tax=Heligmosomoides polygyrus TaxID=6339 RepID=A0A3P7ZGT8_HELPZ|nr:unnamed protein product [Heligmosomoides polygyrus]
MQQRLMHKDKATQTDFTFGPILEEAWTETSDVDSYTTSCSVPYGKASLWSLISHCFPSDCFRERRRRGRVPSRHAGCGGTVAQRIASRRRPGRTITGIIVETQLRSAESTAIVEQWEQWDIEDVVSLDGVEPEHWCVVGEIGADTCVAFQIPSGLRSSPPLDIHRNGKGENKLYPLNDTLPSSTHFLQRTNCRLFQTPRGAPRGLIVPYMYTARQVLIPSILTDSIQIRHVHTTEMKRLIAELDSRLQDCRVLATPRSSAAMSSYGSSA